MKHHIYTLRSVCLFHSSFIMYQILYMHTHLHTSLNIVLILCSIYVKPCRCFLHHCLHFPPNFSLTWLMSSDSLGLPLQFKIKLYEYERCLTLQHETGEIVLSLDAYVESLQSKKKMGDYMRFIGPCPVCMLGAGCDNKIFKGKS